MRPVIAYTSARVAVFIVTAGLLYLVGFKGWLALLLGALVSGVVSYVLLARRRDEMSEAIIKGGREGRARFDAARRKEDVPE